MNYENPAHRLLLILEAGKKLSPSITCEDAWTELLNVNNHSSLLARLGKVITLPADIIQTVHDLYPDSIDITRHWHEQACNMLKNLNMAARWDGIIARVDNHSMTQLKMTAMLLDRELQSRSLTDEAVGETRLTFQKLHDEIMDSDIQQELKVFVLRKLREIITNIDEYKLTGLVPILDAVDSSIGHCVTNTEYKNFIKEHTLGQRFATALTATADSITIATGLPLIAATAKSVWLSINP